VPAACRGHVGASNTDYTRVAVPVVCHFGGQHQQGALGSLSQWRTSLEWIQRRSKRDAITSRVWVVATRASRVNPILLQLIALLKHGMPRKPSVPVRFYSH